MLLGCKAGDLALQLRWLIVPELLLLLLLVGLVPACAAGLCMSIVLLQLGWRRPDAGLLLCDLHTHF
jgi:hypothetical protein